MARRYYKRRRRTARPGFRGRGDYKSTLRNIAKWASRGVGAVGGGLLGAVTGGTNPIALANSIASGINNGYEGGSNFSKMMGWGDYWNAQPVGNQIIKGGARVPMTVNSSSKDLSGDVYITHREFLGRVTASGANGSTVSGFQNTQYSINAALANSFPWLSQIAQNFVMYEFQGLIYEYKPTSGEFGATNTNAVGKVIMATQYDPDATQFLSDVVMENYDYANSCKPSIGMVHAVECKRKQKATNMLYTRTGATTRDRIFTDLGLFQIASQGIPVPDDGSTVTLGELWVTYKVKLSRAQIWSSGGLANDIAQDSFLSRSSSTNILGDTVALIASSTALISYYPGPNTNGFGALRKGSILNGRLYSIDRKSIIYEFPQGVTNGIYQLACLVNCPGGHGVANYFEEPLSTDFALCGLTNLTGIMSFNAGAWRTAIPIDLNTFMILIYVVVNAPGNSQATVKINAHNDMPDQTQVMFTVCEQPLKLTYGPDAL